MHTWYCVDSLCGFWIHQRHPLSTLLQSIAHKNTKTFIQTESGGLEEFKLNCSAAETIYIKYTHYASNTRRFSGFYRTRSTYTHSIARTCWISQKCRNSAFSRNSVRQLSSLHCFRRYQHTTHTYIVWVVGCIFGSHEILLNARERCTKYSRPSRTLCSAQPTVQTLRSWSAAWVARSLVLSSRSTVGCGANRLFSDCWTGHYQRLEFSAEDRASVRRTTFRVSHE